MATIEATNQLFYHYFRDYPFIPNQGNHDTYPIEQSTPLLNHAIRTRIANSWRPLIGHNEAESFIYGGYLIT